VWTPPKGGGAGHTQRPAKGIGIWSKSQTSDQLGAPTPCGVCQPPGRRLHQDYGVDSAEGGGAGHTQRHAKGIGICDSSPRASRSQQAREVH